MGVPNVFGSATTSIPLSQLDQNFNTTATLGNAAIGLGNVTTTVGNLTLTNVNITSGTINAAVTQSGFTGNSVIYSNTSGNLTTSANLTFDGSTLTTLNSAYTGTLTGGTGVVNLGSGQFYKDASGKVGIGTSNPADTSGYGLCVDGNSSTGFGYYARQAGSSTNFFAMGISNSNGILSLANTTGFMAFYTNAGSERMRIDSSGNLLVGTTASGSATKSILLSSTGYLDWGNGDCRIADSSGAMLFYTYTTGNFGERMRLDGNGELLINATSSYVTKGFLQVAYTSANSNAIVVKNTDTNYGSYAVAFQNSTGGVAGYIQMTSATTTVFGVTSDKRLKTDKGVCTDTSVIDNTIIHDFVWSENEISDKGVFAQEAYDVKPSAIHKGSDEINENGQFTNPWGVDYSKYVPDLIVYCQQLKKVAQEQQAIIENLTNRLNALEGK